MDKTTVLIVEDEAIVAADLAGKLEELGYDVAGIAAEGEEAVEMACRVLPRIVLMDIWLKGSMDGIEAAETIRRRIDVPVIYLTAHSDSATLARAKLSEPFGYILKPFEERELATNIEMALYKHQSDRQLREQREWLRVTLTSIGDAVVTCDTDGRVTFLNPVAQDLSGWTPDDGRGRPIQEVFRLVNEKTRQPQEDPVALVLQEGRPRSLANHTALITRDGREIPIEDSAAPILDVKGQVIGAVLVFHDVTAKRRAGEALRESEGRLARALRIANVGIWEWDLQTGEVVWCDRMYHMFGEERGSFIPTYESFLSHLHEEDRRRVDDIVRDALSKLGSYETEYRIIAGTSEPRVILAQGEVVCDSAGRPLRVMGTALDLTARKRVEEALRKAHGELELRVQERTAQLSHAYEALQREAEERRKAEEQLRQAQKMEAVGTLAGGIAHDFNNILAAILGFTEMALEDVADNPSASKSLENVLKSAMRARELVKQILAFSRKTGYARNPISLSPLIRETVQLLRASIPTTIDIRLAVTATSDTVLAAPVEVQQILMNLATNAALAMQDTGGTLGISLTDIDFEPDSPVLGTDVMAGEYVQLAVEDTGVGMSPQVMRRVFEPFFTTREVGKGTGMGLAVVYGIVKDLQGTVTVESEPGVGTVFRVLLPKVRTDAKAEVVQTIEVPGGHEKILFLDDEEMLVEWGQTTLERLGYNVTAVTDSVEALKMFSSDPSWFDLVITDQTMPSMTGMQLAMELLKIRPEIPIILCSGHSETVSPERVRNTGIRESLMKPLARQELAAIVRRVLDAKTEACG